MIDTVVVDTNVMVSALMKADSAPRRVLQACLQRQCQALMGNALLAEYEAVLCRQQLFKDCVLSEAERLQFLDDFLSVCEWVSVYYLWRPNLRDEADNHVLELAVAGGAQAIVTGNTADFHHSALHFPAVEVITPRQFISNLEH